MHITKRKHILQNGGRQGGLNLPLSAPFTPSSHPIIFLNFCRFPALWKPRYSPSRPPLLGSRTSPASCSLGSRPFSVSITKVNADLHSIVCFHARDKPSYWFTQTEDDFCIKIDFSSQRTGLVHQYGNRFFGFEHQYDHRDIT